jgi:hypothetical protein
VQSSYYDSTHPQTLATFGYTPFGALATLTDGCAPSPCTPAPVVETYTYNNRLQRVAQSFTPFETLRFLIMGRVYNRRRVSPASFGVVGSIFLHHTGGSRDLAR